MNIQGQRVLGSRFGPGGLLCSVFLKFTILHKNLLRENVKNTKVMTHQFASLHNATETG